MSILSIIVPIYNTEQYLARCIDSILAQSFTDFELILIDDGSPDNCGRICDEYAEKDKRIRVFHKENGGVSSARNIGLNAATGKYVGFVDPDDSIIPRMYEILLSGFLSNPHVQLSVGNIKYIPNTDYENHLSNIPPFDDIQPTFLDSKEAISLFFNKQHYQICDKLFDRRLIGDLRFDESIRLSEDLLFLSYYLAKVQGIAYFNDDFYLCRIREGSAVRGGTKSTYILQIPKTNYTIMNNITKLCPAQKDTMIFWAFSDYLSWQRKIPDEKLRQKAKRDALKLRIRAFFCQKIHWKTRLLFLTGLLE